VKIKVAIIIERVDISLGGAERSIAELSSALQARELDVTILAAQGNSDSDNVRILCNECPGKRTGHAVFEKALKHHLRHNSYDIIHSTLPFSFAHVYQPRGGSYAETVLRSAASYENAWVTTIKRLTACANRRRQVLLHAEAALCRDPDGPILAALSQYVVDQFKEHYQLNAQRIALIRNGVNTRRPIDQDAAKHLKARISKELKLKDRRDANLFLFAAHNFRLKGLAPLLRAMAELRRDKAECPCYLLIAGHGDASTYTRLAQGLGLEGRITFIGAVDHIQNTLSVVDVAVLPTFYDPASRFILEALAHNRPVITTRFNGAADLFVDHQHGRIIDSPTDISALSEALVQMSCPDTLMQMQTAIVQDKVVEGVSIDRAAGELIDLYQSILPRKGQNK
jgi:UDP-glucose:(heptosyl)LPS alpha-1,3-glucosyltransferase